MSERPEIVLQVDLGGMSIAFTAPAGGTERELNEQLDLYGKVIGRQRAKQQLAEKLVDLLAHKKTLADLPNRLHAMLKLRAEDRVRLRASMEAAHNAAGKRVEFAPNKQQMQALAAFDAETEAERGKHDKEREGHESMIPLIEAQIERLRAVIAGGDPVEPLEREAKEMPEAAD